jgi:hypothetical protein
MPPSPIQPRSSSLSSKPLTIHPVQKPKFARPLQNITVKEKQRATLQCVIDSASPDTQIKWYNNGNQIEPSTDYITNFDSMTGLCTLTIAEAFQPDSGQYTCVATNPAGSESSIAWLVVKPDQQTVPEQQRPVNEPPFKKTVSTKPHGQEPPYNQRASNNPLRLGAIESSLVDDNSQPKIQSPKPVEIVRAYPKYPESQQPQQQQQQQQIPQASEDTSNRAPARPRILNPLRDLPLVEGGQAVFECKLQGHPLNIQWFKGNKELKNQYRYKISCDDKTGVAKLLITTLFEDDADTYSIRVSNPLGEDSTSSRLIPYRKDLFNFYYFK